MKNHFNTNEYCTPIQLKIPIDLTQIVDISDTVYTFNEVFSHINPYKYLSDGSCWTGRKRYDEVKLLKVVLFAFMDGGYASLRNIEKLCKTDVRFIWLLDGLKAPSFKTINNFINKRLAVNIEILFRDINKYLFAKNNVDLEHVYIDGTKIEANANKYSWVWKKSCITNRLKLFSKITKVWEELNSDILCMYGVRFELREEYSIEYVEFCVDKLKQLIGIQITDIPKGKGHRKTQKQRLFQLSLQYLTKLKEYATHISTFGEDRNSYSKTDKGATFMRIKTDYMGNDQLLPAYNMQVATCDEYIAAVDVQQFASDMDCFIPLMEKFNMAYGQYPKYPVADAGYGSYNNYLYCQEHGMEKYMKFTMFKKETDDKEYRQDPFRVRNFSTNQNGELVCPNNKRFLHVFNRPVRYNKYGRTEEIHECEDCYGCPYKDKCHKSQNNRRITLNREFSAIHQEVLNNLNSTHGGLLRMNRSIQSEGTFAILKWDRGYNRAKRKGIEAIFLEFSLISIGFNLYKYHNKRWRTEIPRPPNMSIAA